MDFGSRFRVWRKVFKLLDGDFPGKIFDFGLLMRIFNVLSSFGLSKLFLSCSAFLGRLSKSGMAFFSQKVDWPARRMKKVTFLYELRSVCAQIIAGNLA